MIKIEIDTQKFTGQSEFEHIADELNSLSEQLEAHLNLIRNTSGTMPGSRSAFAAIKHLQNAVRSLRRFDESGY